VPVNDDFEVRQDPSGAVYMPRDQHGETTSADLARTGEDTR